MVKISRDYQPKVKMERVWRKVKKHQQTNCVVSRSFMKRDNSGEYITVTSNPVGIIVRTNEHKPVSKN